MGKPRLKFLVDVLLYAALSSIAATGFVLGVVVPPGRGRGGDRYFLGLHRHEWGDIHSFFALLLLVLLAVHLVLNWGWVAGMAKKTLGPRWQRRLGLISASWIAILALSWLLVRCSPG